MKHVALAAALTLSAPIVALADTPPDQLVVGLSMNNILTLDPAAISGREATGVIANLYDTLVELDPVDKTKVNPGLASAWTIADDGAVTFTLREGAKFTSGNPVTAEDVVWSIKRNISLGLVGAGVWSSFGYKANNIDQFLSADGDQITIRPAQPTDPQLTLAIFGKPDASAVIDKKTALSHETNGDQAAAWLKINAAGSGAFSLTRWSSNEMLILTRSDDYWGEKPQMKRVIYRHMPESQTKRLMLEKGDIDVAIGLSVPDIAALSKNPEVEVQRTPSSGFYFLAVSMKDERFKNPDVRLAIRYLIDYEGINKVIMPNYGTKRLRPVAEGVIGSLPDPDYKVDVAKAKELLARAGYPNGFSVRLLTLNEPPFADAATAIQATLAQAGIKAEIVQGAGDQIYGPMRERKFEMIVGRGGGGQEPHPHSNLRALVINPNNADDAKLSGIIGWRTSFYDEQLNDMSAKALVERDHDKQKAMYEDIQTRYEELVPALQPISAVIDSVVYRADVRGYQNHYGWTVRLRSVSKQR
ncbi:ABC transporter substrate-binding protein [Neorhizobium sp. DT-125]|uniref:ABC transporter substrate-binding protein n=1 Tax=Neorhizobium sp. DT-125 TaxID=3396163 RepID=UPI003F194CFB